MYDLAVVTYRGGKYAIHFIDESEKMINPPDIRQITEPDAVGIIVQDADTGEVLEQNFIDNRHRKQFFRRT